MASPPAARPTAFSRAGVLVAVLIGIAGAAPLRGASLVARDLLEAYGRGDRATVERFFATSTDSLRTFPGDLEEATTEWLASRPEPDRPHGRLVAASLALEVAHGLRVGATPVPPDTLRWSDRMRLVEWGAHLLGQTPVPPPLERTWYLAAVAFLEESYGAPFYAFRGAWDADQRLLAMAAAREPNEPRLRLARAVLAEETTGVLGYVLDDLPDVPLDAPRVDVTVVEPPGGRIDLVLRPPTGQRKGAKPSTFPTDETDFRLTLREAVRGYAALLDQADVGVEAHLRLGTIEVYLDEPELAYGHLAAAARATADPVLHYAAECFLGAALTRLGQVQGAEAAFRAALVTAPRAQAATVGLAWILMLNEHREEASALVADQIRVSSPATDPLMLFTRGDARLWDTEMRALRAGVVAR